MFPEFDFNPLIEKVIAIFLVDMIYDKYTFDMEQISRRDLWGMELLFQNL